MDDIQRGSYFLTVDRFIAHVFIYLFRNFAPTPIPEMDFDPVAMAFHVRAQKAQSDVLYTGAAVNTKKL